MIAVDSNVLVYSSRADSPWYQQADQVVTQLAESRSPWAIPWPCLYEFLSVVTNPRIYSPPTATGHALLQLAGWLESPSLVLLAETAGFSRTLEEILKSSEVVGARVHDARIAALCHYHGVERLLTADRDFSRFGHYIRTENPLLNRRG